MVAPIVIAALISAAASAGGGLLQSQQKNKEIALQRQALLKQQENAKQQMKLAQMKQSDPYGNVFNPRTGRYSLTDESRGLLTAQQGEQQKALTTDATRNRAAREREDARARAGEEEFYNTLNEYRYGDRPSESESVADYTRALMLARDRGGRETTQNIGRQAIRGLANSSVLQSLLRKGQENQRATLEEAVLKGRMGGQREFRERQAGRQAELGGWLDKFGNIAGSTTQATIPNVAPPSMGANATQNMITALQNASTGQSSAMSKLASSTGGGGYGSILSGLAPSIMTIGKYYQGQADATNAADPNSWMVSTTPSQTYDEYGIPYARPWNWTPPEDVLEEERKAKGTELNLN